MKWTFTPPTEREDGTELSAEDISHYVASIGGYEYVLPKDATEVEVDLPDGTHCCSIVCVDTDGQPSVVSNEVCQTQDSSVAPPNPPVIDDPNAGLLNPTSVSPADGATGVPVDAQVIATWDDGVDASGAEIVVKDSLGNVVDGGMIASTQAII